MRPLLLDDRALIYQTWNREAPTMVFDGEALLEDVCVTHLGEGKFKLRMAPFHKLRAVS